MGDFVFIFDAAVGVFSFSFRIISIVNKFLFTLILHFHAHSVGLEVFLLIAPLVLERPLVGELFGFIFAKFEDPQSRLFLVLVFCTFINIVWVVKRIGKSRIRMLLLILVLKVAQVLGVHLLLIFFESLSIILLEELVRLFERAFLGPPKFSIWPKWILLLELFLVIIVGSQMIDPCQIHTALIGLGRLTRRLLALGFLVQR